METYKPTHIPELLGKYEISDHGNFKNVQTNGILKQSLRSGYKSLSVNINGKSKSLKIHILVARVFLIVPEDTKDMIVNHKNGKKLDNHVDNLEWITRSGNVIHAYQNNLINPFIRSVIQYDTNNNIVCEFDSIKQASEMTQIDETGILRVCKKQRNTAGGYLWSYKEQNENEFVSDEVLKEMIEVKGYSNYMINKKGMIYNKKFKKLMIPSVNADGYEHIQLVYNKSKKDFLIHRLVAMMFIDNPEKKYYVNHIDKNRRNNNVTNLEWCTASENNIHKNKN